LIAIRLDYYLMKLLPELALSKLLDIFKIIINDGFFPDMWRRYTVVAVCIANLLRVFKKEFELELQNSLY